MATAREAAADAEGLQQFDEPLRPPALADRAAAAAGRDPVVDRQGARVLEEVAVAGAIHQCTATVFSEDSVTSSRSWAVSSSVSQLSPFPTTRSSEVPLAGDQVVDLLFERAGGDELAHLHVSMLADPERAVGGLVLDRRVPPAVEVDHVVRGSEVEAGAAGLQRHQEHRGPRRLEARHHLVPGVCGGAPVEVQPSRPKRAAGSGAASRRIRELGEAQDPVALGEDFLEDLLERG